MSDIFDIVDEEPIQLTPAPALSHHLHLGIEIADRVLHIADEIVPEDAGRVWQILNEWDGHPAHIHLNTPGGDVDAMYSIHDAIRRHGNVTVLSYGMCCSAGVLILACAHKRFVTESLIWMSHESTTGDGGGLGYRAAKDRRRVDDWQHQYWAELMARYTPQEADWWKRKTERQAEYWLLGGQAVVEAGCADEVI